MHLRRASWLLPLLLSVALLLAQTLGQLHRIAHGHAQHLSPVAGQIADAPPAAFSAAFDSHEDGSADCQLFDGLSTGSGLLTLAAPLLALPRPLFALAFTQAQFTACRTALCEARGPPFSL